MDMDTQDITLIDRLAAAIAGRINLIPIDVDLWDASRIGEFLKVGSRQVLERYAPLPNFPRAIRLPTPSGGKGQPLWKAVEVIAWAEKFKENDRRIQKNHAA